MFFIPEKNLWLSETVGPGVRSDLVVDVQINAISKDLAVLPLTVKSVRKFLRHPIGIVRIVGPDIPEIRDFCRVHDCKFQDEDDVLPIRLASIDYVVSGVDRSGWIFQQLLKLGCCRLTEATHVFVIDADTVLLQPQKFESKGKEVLLSSDEYHQPYLVTFKEMFGISAKSRKSFIAHQMLFDVGRLREMLEELEERHGRPWHEVIVSALDPHEMSCFSEYETYGNWMTARYPEEIVVEYWRNRALARKRPLRLKSFICRLFRYRSVSYHSYSAEL